MMTRDEALNDLRNMLYAAQHARSVVLETQGDDNVTQMVFTDLEPWLFGPKCVLPHLAAYIGRVEKGAPIEGSTFYNFMWIAKREWAISLSAGFVRKAPLPEPDMAWHGQVFA